MKNSYVISFFAFLTLGTVVYLSNYNPTKPVNPTITQTPSSTFSLNVTPSPTPNVIAKQIVKDDLGEHSKYEQERQQIRQDESLALYNAVKSGRVKLDDLNDDGKEALRTYIEKKTVVEDDLFSEEKPKGIDWSKYSISSDSSPHKSGEYIGNLTRNNNSTINKYDYNSVNNPYGPYGSKYSQYSANNPYTNDAPKLYDSEGNYRGKLSSNPYDPDSISNPYGRYGNKYSSDSINNPYGAGSKYKSDSPNNPYGTGLSIYGQRP